MTRSLDPSDLPQQRLKAVGMLVLAVAVTSTQDAIIKLISPTYPFHQMQFIRSAFALPLILLLTLARGEFRTALGAAGSKLLYLRSFILAMASALYYIALAAVGLADAAVIYFSMPLILSLLSGPMISEWVRARHWIAMLIAFVGVVIIIRPGSKLFEPASLVMIVATTFYALGYILTRPLGRKVPTLVIGLYQNLAFIIAASVLGLLFGGGGWHNSAHPSLSYLTAGWAVPSGTDLMLMGLIGVTAATTILLSIRAYSLAEPSFVAPFEYTGIFWAMLLGFVIWGVVPDLNTLAGAALVIGAGLFMLRSTS